LIILSFFTDYVVLFY